MTPAEPRKTTTLPAWVTADRIAAVLFLALFGLWTLDGFRMHSALVVDVIGPGFFPKLIGVLGCGLALILLFQPRRADDDGRIFSVSRSELTPVIMLLVYVLTIDPLGFPVATTIFVTLGCKYLGCPTWLRAVGLGFAVTAAIFVLFHYGLEARLPFGVLTWVGIGHA